MPETTDTSEAPAGDNSSSTGTESFRAGSIPQSAQGGRASAARSAARPRGAPAAHRADFAAAGHVGATSVASHPMLGTSERRLTIAEALREAIAEEMRRDESVFLIGEDVGIEGGFGGAFGVYLGLVEQFGHGRIIDTPISEKVIAGAATGAALMGMRPIADMQYADFLFECMDELVNQAAKMRYMSGGKLSVPMVMRAPVGTTNRGAQHGQSPESYFMHVPGLKVVCVSDAYSAKGILKSAVRDDNPVLIFEHKLLYGSKGRQQAGGLDLTTHVPREEYVLPLDKAIVKRAGGHVTVVATHLSLYRSLVAAEELAAEGIECEVIDPVSLLPLDTETLWASLRKTGRLAIVHEDTRTGGWGAEVAARAADECLYSLEAPIKRIATEDVPLPFAPVMEQAVVPSVERIKATIKAMFS
jgi:pyruvate/2-oxoglutarate/acetoin dehydrogenase E1 component